MAAKQVSSRLLIIAVLVAAVWLLNGKSFVSVPLGNSAARLSRVAMQAEATADTVAKCQEVIAEQLGVDKEKVVRTATLTELGADSLDIVESVMALEEKFDVELPDEETTALKNVGDVMDLIQSKL
eukprot:TRINITY_DN1396_c0_g1_i1.p2 TRINITY_DN1396_c0_g1~~TRINITY_DN1396_c0_g1_i1.p2  ORF type:complete len:126 (-),score=40.01 TRINITY_DN1396_c0_g1_i1:382-759(-)